MPLSPDSPAEALALLRDLGGDLRAAVVGARGIDMATIEDHTPADTIYAIDKVTDDALLAWFQGRWTDVEVVSEGLHEPLVLGTPRWTVIVDTIDGTRGLMYDKRSAWSLAAVAPHGGTLRDVVAACMTELPTTKQALADQFAGVRRGGVVGARVDLRTGSAVELTPRPSAATDLDHGFAQLAKFFPSGKPALAAIEGELFDRLDATVVFDDEYLASGGQVHELLTGKDRFVADLRPLVVPDALACHPYDICTSMLLEEAGGVVTDPWGAPLDCPLDTTTGVAWVGYANRALADRIGPVLADVLRDHLDAGSGPKRPVTVPAPWSARTSS
jgi:fructose-1,6-bisphosphatase/inositol monophosphatase family enzyme